MSVFSGQQQGLSSSDIATGTDIVAQTVGKLLDATAVVNEDLMVSDSDERIPTQQSVVAYVANQIAGGVTYRGVMPIPADMTTNTTGNAYADANSAYLVGDMFVAAAGGILTLSDGTIAVAQGDALLINTATPDAAITVAMVDDIESSNPSLSFMVGTFLYAATEEPVNNTFAMNGQTIVGGVATYPLLATKWASWVSGANIVLPDWSGRFIRSTGGSAAALGVNQPDATSVNGLSTSKGTLAVDTGGTHQHTAQDPDHDDQNNQNLAWGDSQDNRQKPDIADGAHSHTMSGNPTITSTDSETRPENIALLLCVIAAV